MADYWGLLTLLLTRTSSVLFGCTRLMVMFQNKVTIQFELNSLSI